MKESLLKKEFKTSDVQRMRNLITGKHGDKTKVQAGYEKQIVDRKEGDVWEEDNRTWTIKNGIKQNITKFDSFKKLVILPLTCPECGKPMKSTDLNKKMYSIHSTCSDCVFKMETRLKAEGKYEEYEKKMLSSNRDAYVEDLDKALDAWLNEKDTYVTEQGDIEDWVETPKTKLYNEAKEVLKKVKDAEL